MKVEFVHDKSGNYWLASGDQNGHPVLAEGATRPEAVRRWCENPHPVAKQLIVEETNEWKLTS